MSATFRENRSYQENLWAETLADWGVEVVVITHSERGGAVHGDSTTLAQSPRGAQYTIRFIEAFTLPRNIALTSSLSEVILSVEPHCVVWVGALMYFGRALYLDPRLSEIPLITIYSLSRRGRHPFRWLGGDLTWQQRVKGFAFQALRAPVLTQSIKRAQLTIANTPEATEIIRSYIWHDDRFAWARKHEEIPLGFCPYHFTYHQDRRVMIRQELNLPPNETVALFSTRFESDKRDALLACYEAVNRCHARQKLSGAPLIHMIWVGARPSELHDELLALCAQAQAPERHHIVSFQTRAKLSAWYHASDIILFPQPSISIQEALGVGARVLSPPDPSIDHLHAYTDQLISADIEYWADHLEREAKQIYSSDSQTLDSARESAALSAGQLSYTALVKRALLGLNSRARTLPNPLKMLIEEVRLDSRI